MSKYSRDVLERTAAVSYSLVDLMRKLDAPLGAKPRRYLQQRLAHYGIDTSHFQEEPLPQRPRRSYSREILTEAAARSTSLREMFLYMGIPPEDGPYDHVKRKLAALGIDTSHFRARADVTAFSPEALVHAVAASRGIAEVMRRLGLSEDNGSARAKVCAHIEKHGLSTEHFLGQGHLAGVPSGRRKSAEEVLVRLPAEARRTRTTLLRRALDDLGVPRKCGRCGLGEQWQGRRLVLEIDHIDGDWLDNRRENLRYLCPSCHSQTRTFARRSSRTQ